MATNLPDIQEEVVKSKELITSVQEILSDTLEELAPLTGDPEITALWKDIVSLLSSTASTMDSAKDGEGMIQQLKEKLATLKREVQKRRSDQHEMKDKMIRAITLDVSRLQAELKTVNEEKKMMKKNMEDIEELLLVKKEMVTTLESSLHSKEMEFSKLHNMLHRKEHGTFLKEGHGVSNVATLEAKLRAKEAQLIAAVNSKKKQCDNAAVQADYLAVAEFGLKGVEICGEKVFEVTGGSSERGDCFSGCQEHCCWAF